MILNAVIDDQIYELNVPDALLESASDFFDRMDDDMSHGIQMSREWIASPDLDQRCKAVANKLLTALENENHNLGRLMAGYILTRMPKLERVEIDTSGEMQATQFVFAFDPEATPLDPQLKAEAESRVSSVFKAGKQWKFSIQDKHQNTWRDSPAFAKEDEALSRREEAVKRLYHELARG